ncbi:Hypothetical protein CINCED_3A021970 [Cinara cedri]|uniref:Uncharacterized protein n=1 Tax=Cinara cedri TaxID=506608 RepID=A0A5E4ME04_9HEMI|nr:Hypothetical protein CINCED_3A021970 [Cinara cedri]
MKSFMGGQNFNEDDDVKKAVSAWLQSQALSFYDEGIQKLVPRYDKCLNNGGQSCSNVESNSIDYKEFINEEVFNLSLFVEQLIEIQLQENEENEKEQSNIIVEEVFKDYY